MYDYIIIGGGSAGATLAARLTEDSNTTVCLLEAGGKGESILIRAPAAVITMLPGRPPIHNWCLNTTPQPELNHRRGYQPRGKSLGGSSAINAMLYIRGHRSDYDDWAAQGCAGWSYDEVLPYFKKSEGNERGDPDYHGHEGSLKVADQRSPRPITEAFIKAGESIGIPRTDDFNGAKQEGIGYYQVTQFYDKKRNGERCSAAAAYLHPVMDRKNLTVITHAQVSKILIKNKRAVGVRYTKNKLITEITARKEVLLAAGAFHSPQLLMLSGIGPRAELETQDIEVVHELAGVGQNLQDHLDFTFIYYSQEKNLFGIGLTSAFLLLKHIFTWRKNGTGMVATPFAEGGAFIKSHSALKRPDMQLHFVIALADDHARKLHLGYGYSCHVCLLRPKSRGEVGLTSPDPSAPPRIDPRFLSAKTDKENFLTAVKKARQIMDAPALQAFKKSEMYTQNVDTDTALMEHIRQRADTIYHPIGTCKMGTDDKAVVSPELKVHGIKGLRVIDASVMPTLIGGNTNAPTIMIAEKAADMIKADQT